MTIRYYLISLTEDPGNNMETKSSTTQKKDFGYGYKRCPSQQHSATSAEQEHTNFHKYSEYYTDGLTIARLMDDILQCYLDSFDTTVRERAKIIMTKKLERLNQKLHSYLQSQD